MKRILYIALSSVTALIIGSATLSAQQMVYEPKNPAFGGNPVNYSWMLSSANAQNRFQEQRGAVGFQRDPLEDFQQSLQRQVLSQLTRDIIQNQFGSEGARQTDSTFEFGEFNIEINSVDGGVRIRIFNILTGDETSITVPQF
ncbi:MAG: curli assembly protein CsgF [Bacteroidetes bacterium]|nr:curli assembly protein CsgF [Bacteroidota bacterium]